MGTDNPWQLDAQKELELCIDSFGRIAQWRLEQERRAGME